MLEALVAEGGAGSGRSGSATRSTGSSSPVSSKRGSQTSSCCSNRTATSWPISTSDGLAADDVRRQVDAGVFGQRDVGDDVGRVEVRQPAVGVDREADDGAPTRDRRSAWTTGSGSRGRWARADGPARRSRCSPESAGRRRRRTSRTTRWPGSAQEAAAWQLLDLAEGTCPVLTSTSQSNTVDMLRALADIARSRPSEKGHSVSIDRSWSRQRTLHWGRNAVSGGAGSDRTGRSTRALMRLRIGRPRSSKSVDPAAPPLQLPFDSREESDNHPVRATSQQRRRSVAPGEGREPGPRCHPHPWWFLAWRLHEATHERAGQSCREKGMGCVEYRVPACRTARRERRLAPHAQ